VAAAPSDSPGDAPFGFKAWKSDQPLSIQSEEMEAIQKEGRRTLIFRKNVHVQQGDLDIRCAVLEAYYPADASQPHRLVGKGKVRLVQGQQRAFCDEAVYERVKDRLVCRGNARFEDGDNSLVGEVIHIDLAAEKITVKGGASVLIQPENVSGGDPS
jgi:lipopolysaccharide transport protein LptA